MGFFSQQQLRVVRIDDENTVTVRRLTFGESQAVISESTVFDLVSQEASLDFAKNQVAKLSKAIVAWNGPGFEGRPVTRENIEALPSEVGAIIVKGVEELNKGLTEPEQKNSAAPTST